MALTDSLSGLKATVVDLPNVIPIARKVIAEAGAEDRVDTAEADLLRAPLTGEYDVAVLRAFVQVLSPEDAARATKNVANAVTPGGSIHVIGRVIDDSRLMPISSVGFNLLVLNIFDSGGAYTEGEYRDWLSAAGFEGFEVQPLGAGYTMVSATKPC